MILPVTNGLEGCCGFVPGQVLITVVPIFQSNWSCSSLIQFSQLQNPCSKSQSPTCKVKRIGVQRNIEKDPPNTWFYRWFEKATKLKQKRETASGEIFLKFPSPFFTRIRNSFLPLKTFTSQQAKNWGKLAYFWQEAREIESLRKCAKIYEVLIVKPASGI